MFFKKKKSVRLTELPRHVAFIMDGNGRWAKKRGLPRLFGHNAGTEALKKIVIESQKLGIPYISFYAFSTENWRRPAEEVEGLMKILVKFLRSEIDEIHENNVKINILGDYTKLPAFQVGEVEKALEKTKNNDGMNFNIALNYGGRDEILTVTKAIAASVEAGEVAVEAIDEALFESHLYTSGMPEPDLLIRTSGEQRLSNFMLWQMAYTEFVFEDVFWPDFTPEVYRKALERYEGRHRRFGGV